MELSIQIYFQNSETYNYMMQPPIAHIISTVYLTFTLHFIDRQMDYLNRLDYKWNSELKMKQVNADESKNVNKMLLDNILPRHVGKRLL